MKKDQTRFADKLRMILWNTLCSYFPYFSFMMEDDPYWLRTNWRLGILREEKGKCHPTTTTFESNNSLIDWNLKFSISRRPHSFDRHHADLQSEAQDIAKLPLLDFSQCRVHLWNPPWQGGEGETSISRLRGGACSTSNGEVGGVAWRSIQRGNSPLMQWGQRPRTIFWQVQRYG